MKTISTLMLLFTLSALAACQLPETENLEQFQGTGLRVRFAEWGTTVDDEAGATIKVFSSRAGRRVRLAMFKLYRAGGDRVVYQESELYALNGRNVGSDLGNTIYRSDLYPQLAFATNWYGYIGVLVVGTDDAGTQVWGYDQIYIQKGELRWIFDQVRANDPTH